MITPMIAQETPTLTAPLAPSQVASKMICGVILVSLRNQDAIIVAKIETTAAYSGV